MALPSGSSHFSGQGIVAMLTEAQGRVGEPEPLLSSKPQTDGADSPLERSRTRNHSQVCACPHSASAEHCL